MYRIKNKDQAVVNRWWKDGWDKEQWLYFHFSQILDFFLSFFNLCFILDFHFSHNLTSFICLQEDSSEMQVRMSWVTFVWNILGSLSTFWNTLVLTDFVRQFADLLRNKRRTNLEPNVGWLIHSDAEERWIFFCRMWSFFFYLSCLSISPLLRVSISFFTCACV